MAVTSNSVVTPQNPYMAVGNLSAVTACTTRAPTATASLAAANISILVPAADNVSGLVVSKIEVKGSSSSFTAPTAAQTVTIWLWDPVAGIAYPKYEILTSVVTPSTSVNSGEFSRSFTDFTLKAGWAIYQSTSITTTASTTALVVTAHGALL